MEHRRSVFFAELSFVWHIGSVELHETPVEVNSPLKQADTYEDHEQESSDQETVSMNLLLGREDSMPSLHSQAGLNDLLYYSRSADTYGDIDDIILQSASEGDCDVDPQLGGDCDNYGGLSLQEAVDANNNMTSTGPAVRRSTRSEELYHVTAYLHQLRAVRDEIYFLKNRSEI